VHTRPFNCLLFIFAFFVFFTTASAMRPAKTRNSHPTEEVVVGEEQQGVGTATVGVALGWRGLLSWPSLSLKTSGDPKESIITTASLTTTPSTSILTTTSTTTTKEPGAIRRAYINQKLSVERAGLQSIFNSTRNLATPPVPAEPGANRILSRNPKVAFLVMTDGELASPAIWDAFFSGAPSEKFSIYLHASSPEEQQSDDYPLKCWGAIRVPHQRSEWCASFALEVGLLAHALRDPDNTQFVFVSGTTIPLKPFSYVYRQLIQHSPFTSKFCLASPADYLSMQRQAVKIELVGGCYFKDYYRYYDQRVLKHHQWVVLSRAHAAIVVRHSPIALKAFGRAWRLAAPDIKNLGDGCSDEAVPLTALLLDLELRGESTNNTWQDLTRLGVEQQCLTFARWRSCLAGTVFEYGELRGLAANVSSIWASGSEIFEFLTSSGRQLGDFKKAVNGFPFEFSQVQYEYLESLVSSGFMFARKFMPDSNVTLPDGTLSPLDEVLPPMLRENETDHPELRVWTHLETAGEPSPLAVP